MPEKSIPEKPTADWDDLAREWDLWRNQEQRPTLWWRDDDAVDITPALEDLRRIARVPVALAVIPMAMERPLQPRLATYLQDWSSVRVLQHGVGHLNHANAGAKKSEFPATRPIGEIELALTVGGNFLRDVFGARALPVLTPPWNRIGEPALALLPRLGLRGVTRFDEWPYGTKTSTAPVFPTFREINTQIDVIDWRGTRGFVGMAPALGRLVAHLAARRQGIVDPRTPTGILTHHLVHDTATWRFIENLQDWLAQRGELDVFQDPEVLWPQS